ncbi:MAG TPA: magnesium/cobalt transporter CorA [Myxococcota bacterium]|nr:magnesium/cobalt transporter CorA [Myxococcota bacterium]
MSRSPRARRSSRTRAPEAHGSLHFLGSRIRFTRRAPPPGTRPGVLVVPEGAPKPVVRVMRYDAGQVEEKPVEDVEQLAALVVGGGVTWIDVQGFGDPAFLERIREILGIHPLAMADVVNVPQRPKAEPYGDRYLVVTRMATMLPERRIHLEQLSLVIGPGWVATFQEDPGDCFDPLRERIRHGLGVIRRMGADFLAYALLDAVVDGYFPVVEELGGVLEALEEEAMEDADRATLGRIHAARRLLLQLERLQWQQRESLSGMLHSAESPFSDPVRLYLRDVHDHAVQVLDVIETYRQMTVGLVEIYLSSVNNRMNEVMKTLTVVATIFIPLTFLVGVYGMNFDYMPELRERWGYAAVWAVMLVVALGLVYWFHRRGWLERGDGGR